MTSIPNPNAPTNINITVDARTGPEQQTGGLSKRAEATYKATCDMITATGNRQPMPRREDFAHITDEDAPPLANATTLVPVDLEKDRASVVAGRTYQAMVEAAKTRLGNGHIRQD